MRSVNFLEFKYLLGNTCCYLIDCAAGGCACTPMAQAAMGSGPWGSIDAVMNVQVRATSYLLRAMSSLASEDIVKNRSPPAVYTQLTAMCHCK